VREVPRIAADLHRLLDAHVDMAKAVQAGGARGAERHEKLKTGVRRLIADEAQRQHWKLSKQALADLFSVDDDLNAQGLAIWLDAQAV
jgi:hydroxyacylglutathione hydrolase